MMQFPHLFQPLRIRNVTLRNRITSSAHGTSLSLGGIPTAEFAAYHQARARGGIGLIVTEGIRIHPTTMSHALAIAGWRDEIIEPLARVAEAVHAEGAAIFAQILHQGRQVGSAYSQTRLLAPSPLACPLYKEVPSEMTHEDIREIVAAFAGAARRVKAAGFDGVEIHGAHGYLIQEFLSPFSNQRQDEYGGSLENRLRFAFEVLDAVRREVGDFVVGMRLSVDEFTEGGLGVDEMKVIARRIADTEQVDFFSLSHSNYNGPSYSTMIPDMQYARAAYVGLQAAVKAVIPELPTVSVGRIIDPAEAERIIAEGQADLVAMTRAQIADPELAIKASTGRANEIRTCISCNQGCAGMVHAGQPIRCVVNPAAGRELALSRIPATRSEAPKRVVVVGGGPAGLEAAGSAAVRGHRVTLFERDPVTGGQIRTAALAKQRREIVQLVDQQAQSVERFRVDLRLGTEATAESILALDPDVVILATGSRPHPHPLGLIDVADALCNPGAIGPRIVIVDEDRHFKAAGAAEYFAKQGREVTLVTAAPDVGTDIPGVSLVGLKYRLGDLGVTIIPVSTVNSVNGQSVTVRNLLTGRTETLVEINNVIYAGPYRKNDDLASALAGRVRVIVVGDALAPRRMLDATREGHDAGLAL